MTAPQTWLELPEGTQFGVANLPYGVFSTGRQQPRVGVRIGDHLLDLAPALDDDVFALPSLNQFMAQGRPAWTATRARISEMLTDPQYRNRVEPLLVRLDQVGLHLPFDVGDYVDFYASEHHASNIGRIFRPDPLTPNWKHLPIGYTGDPGPSSSPERHFTGPSGNGKPRRIPYPRMGLRVGWTSKPRSDSSSASAPRWVVASASTISLTTCSGSAWSTTGRPGTCKRGSTCRWGRSSGNHSPHRSRRGSCPCKRCTKPAYLRRVGTNPSCHTSRTARTGGLDLTLEVKLNDEVVSRPPMRTMYWTAAQMLAHMTVNGASTRTGDLYASGTISGPDRDQVGSLMELSRGGQEPFSIGDSQKRTFLEDGDVVTITGSAPGPDGQLIGFGEVVGRILPAEEPT